MPLSIDEATRRYQCCVQNIQDSIFALESFMGSNTMFTFDMPQAIGNLDEVDITKEERDVSLQIQSLEEYKKIIAYERKRRAMAVLIQEKQGIDQMRMQLKVKRRADRVAVSPYSKYKQAPPPTQASTQEIPIANTDTSMTIDS